MKFTKTTKEAILKKNEKRTYNYWLKNDLLEFLATGYEYAQVEDDHYNNNNDLRRAIQSCIEYNDLPIAVFMYRGITYVQRLSEGLT